MLRSFNPATVAAPASTYSHGFEVPPNARLVFLSGQVAMRPDGTVPQGIEAQTEQVWKNIGNCLAEAGMGIGDIVKFTSFLTRTEDLAKYGEVRNRFLAAHRPTSTLLVIQSLARPELLVEVEVIAAKA